MGRALTRELRGNVPYRHGTCCPLDCYPYSGTTPYCAGFAGLWGIQSPGLLASLVCIFLWKAASSSGQKEWEGEENCEPDGLRVNISPGQGLGNNQNMVSRPLGPVQSM